MTRSTEAYSSFIVWKFKKQCVSSERWVRKVDIRFTNGEHDRQSEFRLHSNDRQY